MEFSVTAQTAGELESLLLEEKKELIKKHLQGMAFAIAEESKAGQFHKKSKHNTSEGFAELYGLDVALVETCINELKDEGKLAVK